MKKILKLKFLVCLVMSLVFSACSKEEIDSSRLIGKWQSVYRYAWVERNWNGKSEYNREYNQAFFVFRSDGTCDFYDPESIYGYSSKLYKDVAYGKSLNYKLGIFIVDVKFKRDIFIKSVTSNRLVVIETNAHNDGYNYEEMYEETVYEKVD